MTTEYYIKHYKPLKKMYKEYHDILLRIKENPDDKELRREKIRILKQIKRFLRYEKKYHKWYK